MRERPSLPVARGCTSIGRLNLDWCEQESDPKNEPFDSSREHLPQKKSSSVPVVVVEGSGRAADFISFVWRHMHERKGECHAESCGPDDDESKKQRRNLCVMQVRKP